MASAFIDIPKRPFPRGQLLSTGAILFVLSFVPSVSVATPATSHQSQEDGAVVTFLQSDAADWKPTTFCVNMTLAGLDRDSIQQLSLLPGASGKSPQAQSYLKDLKLVSEGSAPRPTGSMAADGLRTVAFKIRTGTYGECADLPTYRFNRVMMKKNKAVVSGRFATKCATVPFGANLRSRNGKWAVDYVTYYQSVAGPPGCSQMAKVYAGSETDTFLIMER